MINQSLQFDITGKDADLFLRGCVERGITPRQAFGDFIESFIQFYPQKNTTDNSAEYSQEVTNYLLNGQKDYQKFSTVEALFEDLELCDY